MSSESTLYTATILASLPEIGLAVVTKDKSAPSLSNLIIAYLPYGDSAYGATPIAQFAVGSCVLCVSNNEHPVAYIVGCVHDKPGDNGYYGGELFYHVGKISEKICTMELTAESNLMDSLLQDLREYVRNARANCSGDALPGDFDVTDSAGLVGFHVGRLLSALRGSPLAFVDVSAITHKVRVVGKTLEFHTLAGETCVSDNLTVLNTATSAREALGLLDDSTFSSVDDIPDALPFYRMQELKGGAVDGNESMVLLPPIGKELHTTAAPPTPLNKHRTSISGEEQRFSAHSIGSIKTPDIRGILQANYGATDNDSEQPPTELRVPFTFEPKDKKQPPEEIDPELLIDDAALHQAERYDADYTEKMQTLLAEEGLSVGTASLKTAVDADSLPVLGPTPDSMYPLPPSLKITDPRTGREHTYFLSTSFIRQLEDGSIAIGDGYGSEIRLSRGNIYIASALDTFIRPGRDCVQMVPRNLVLNTQHNGIFNAKGSLYFRASRDLKIANTGEYNGHLTIECRSIGGYSQPDPDDPTNKVSCGGLSIRSNSDMSITCRQDMYIGRNKHTASKKKGVTEPEDIGSIILSAGRNGTITQLAGECSMDAKNVYLKAHDGDSGTVSLFLLTPTVAIAGVPAMQVTGSLVLQRYSGDLKVHCRVGDDKMNLTVQQADSCHLMVSGTGQFGDVVKVNAQFVVAGQVVAHSVAAGVPQMYSIDSKYLPKPDFPDPEEAPSDGDETKKGNGKGNLGQNVENILDRATAEGSYRDSFIMDNAFAFPSDYGLPQDLRMPAMLWQTVETDAGAMWEELPVKDELGSDKTSWCYPGALWKEGGTIGDAEYGKSSLNGNYRTNTYSDTYETSRNKGETT